MSRGSYMAAMKAFTKAAEVSTSCFCFLTTVLSILTVWVLHNRPSFPHQPAIMALLAFLC